MSRMGEFFIAETLRKFGDELPNMETTCAECGKAYGEHYMIDCQPPEIPAGASQSYATFAKQTNRERLRRYYGNP